jgi:hypothetical protein
MGDALPFLKTMGYKKKECQKQPEIQSKERKVNPNFLNPVKPGVSRIIVLCLN